jgi:DeoR family transcriptional regulator, suf operon transcriptional repressor
MTTARQKVLTYLNKTRMASVREVSRALNMPAANVRHHLRVLVSDGRLETSIVVKGERRGRPEKLYSLPRAALGDNLSALSAALLAETSLQVRMETLARHMAGDSNFMDQPLAKRLNLLIEKLNQMNYHSRWEAGPEGPRVIFGHCPYAAIIEKHPELCVMDVALLEQLMGQAAKQVTTIRDGSKSCVFVMGR